VAGGSAQLGTPTPVVRLGSPVDRHSRVGAQGSAGSGLRVKEKGRSVTKWSVRRLDFAPESVTRFHRESLRSRERIY